MNILNYIKALYIFLAFILLGFASAVALSFPSIARYAYSVALFLHSIIILFIFIQELKRKQPPALQKSEQ